MKIFADVSMAFYKTMFFNELAKKEDILVIFRDNPKRPFRGSDFLVGERNFKHVFLKGTNMQACKQLVRILRENKYDELIVGGYDNIIAWTSMLVSPKRKNGVIIESTYRETQKKGLKTFAKRFFFRRVSKTYVCGKSHSDLVKAFGFKGRIIDIGTVGFIRRVLQPPYEERKEVKKFIFVGRLTRVKNLEWLIERFAQHSELDLTIIGAGELEVKLKSIAPDNVHFLGAIANTDLPHYYKEADVFVLPSLSEVFGLVVEEALNNGTPVLLSHMIGCQDNLVAANKVGLVFQLDDVEDFEQKLSQICTPEIYNQLRLNVSKLDFEQLENNMVNAFVGK